MTQRNGHERSSQSADGRRPGRTASSVSLLDVEPELGPLLAGEQFDQAGRFALPARTVMKGTSVIGTLKETDAFGAIVLNGLLLHGTQIGKRPALRLVEPGDVVPFSRGTPALPLATVSGLRCSRLNWHASGKNTRPRGRSPTTLRMKQGSSAPVPMNSSTTLTPSAWSRMEGAPRPPPQGILPVIVSWVEVRGRTEVRDRYEGRPGKRLGPCATDNRPLSRGL